MSNKKYKKQVLMLLAEGFELIETSCFTDVFAWASFQDDVDISVTSTSLRTPLKTAFGGFVLSPESLIADVDLSHYDGLAIPGGMEWAGFFEDALSDEFGKVVQHFTEHNKPIAAVCVASMSLAKAGKLSGKKATIYHSLNGKHKANLEQHGATFIDTPIVKDGNITTSTGPGTAVEVALSLLGDLTDPETVQSTRQMMRIPVPQESWYSPQV